MIGIKYVSLHEPSGYGIAGRRYIQGLRNCGVPLTWSPMVNGHAGYVPFYGNIDDPELGSVCNVQIPYDTVIVHTVPEYFPFWTEREKGKTIIGYTVWETDKLPHHWPSLLNRMDRIFVPCRWNAEVFRKCGVECAVDVIPHISANVQTTEAFSFKDIRNDDFIFYCINTWTARKAIWKTIQCYLDCFTRADPVVLILKTSRRDLTKHYFRGFYRSTRRSLRHLLKRYSNPARICLLDQALTEEEMLQLHQRGDCYISLCRSEGWGLGAFDAAAHGNPIIITGYGGQLDYLLPESTYIVEHTMIPVNDPGPQSRSYSNDQLWAEPDVAHAAKLMKHVFTHRDEAAEKGKQLQRYVSASFHEKTISEKILAIVGKE
jgi:glycosyltransferase involved in cell wall biosynthesis